MFKQSPYFVLADQGLIPIQAPPAPRWIGILALRPSTVIVTCLTWEEQCLSCAQLLPLAVAQQSEQLLAYTLIVRREVVTLALKAVLQNNTTFTAAILLYHFKRLVTYGPNGNGRNVGRKNRKNLPPEGQRPGLVQGPGLKNTSANGGVNCSIVATPPTGKSFLGVVFCLS